MNFITRVCLVLIGLFLTILFALPSCFIIGFYNSFSKNIVSVEYFVVYGLGEAKNLNGIDLTVFYGLMPLRIGIFCFLAGALHK